jgi:hypothetical protein
VCSSDLDTVGWLTPQRRAMALSVTFARGLGIDAPQQDDTQITLTYRIV